MSARTRIWIFIVGILCAALVLLGVVGGLMPGLTQASGTYRTELDTRDRNEALRVQIQELEDAQAEIGELEERYEELAAAIPAKVDTKGFLETLQEIEGQTDARVTGLTFEPDGVVAGAAPPASNTESEAEGSTPATTLPNLVIERIAIALIVEGDPDQIVDFFTQLQSIDRLVFVNNFEVVSLSDTSTATFHGLIFTQASS